MGLASDLRSRDPGVRSRCRHCPRGRGVCGRAPRRAAGEITDGAALLVVDRATREVAGDGPSGGRRSRWSSSATTSMTTASSPSCSRRRSATWSAIRLRSRPGDHLGKARVRGPVRPRKVSGPRARRSASASIQRRRASARAIGEVCAWAEAIGARRPIVHRLASVVDELLMNALHDAPRESKPTSRSAARSPSSSARPALGQRRRTDRGLGRRRVRRDPPARRDRSRPPRPPRARPPEPLDEPRRRPRPLPRARERRVADRQRRSGPPHRGRVPVRSLAPRSPRSCRRARSLHVFSA